MQRDTRRQYRTTHAKEPATAATAATNYQRPGAVGRPHTKEPATGTRYTRAPESMKEKILKEILRKIAKLEERTPKLIVDRIDVRALKELYNFTLLLE